MGWDINWYRAGGGDSPTTVIKIYNGLYRVSYLGKSSNAIKYIVPPTFSVKYLKKKAILKVMYLGKSSSSIKYIKPKSIKITYICKP